MEILLLQVALFCFGFFGGIWSACRMLDAFTDGKFIEFSFYGLLVFLGSFSFTLALMWMFVL